MCATPAFAFFISAPGVTRSRIKVNSFTLTTLDARGRGPQGTPCGSVPAVMQRPPSESNRDKFKGELPMRVKRLSSLFCAVAFCGTASVAMAGAYGEAEQAEEMPHPAPAVAETAT